MKRMVTTKICLITGVGPGTGAALVKRDVGGKRRHQLPLGATVVDVLAVVNVAGVVVAAGQQKRLDTLVRDARLGERMAMQCLQDTI